MATTKQGGIKDVAVGRSDIFRLPIDKLTVKAGWNCRDRDFDPTDEADVALAISISNVGVREPLTVVWEDGAAVITNGHRRYAATRYAIENLGAEIASVPVKTEDRYASEGDRVLSQIVRNAGKPLSPIEQARVFKRLIDLGWVEQDIATKAGLSTTRVRQLLNLHAAPEAVTDAVRSGQVSASLAIHVLGDAKGDGEAATKTIQKAVETAAAAGKARATAKHISRPSERLSLKEQLREVFDASTVDDKLDELDAYVVIIPAAQWAVCRRLLDL